MSATSPRSRQPRRLMRRLALGLSLACLGAWGSRSTAPALARETRDFDQPAIIGGREARRGAWPHQVAILDAAEPSNYDGQYCGGSLISEEWVLTAAHCVEGAGASGELDAADIEVGLGMHDLEAQDGRRVAVAQIVIHPDWFSSGTEVGDIALLRLAAPVVPGTTVKPIGLVERADDPALAPGLPAWVTGWGMLDDGEYASTLHEVDVPLVDELLCRLDSEQPAVGESLCAGSLGKDTCYGDSGGPLVVGTAGAWRLAGLTSAGTTDVCGGEDNYTLYTSVPHYLAWIRAVMADRSPDLELAIDAPEVIRPGEVFSYRLTVRNSGREPAEGLVLSDVLPPGLAFRAVSDGGQQAGEALRWQLGSLAPGAERGVSVTVEELPGRPGSPIDADPEAVEDWALGEAAPAEEAGADGLAPSGEAPALPDVVGGRDAARQAWPWQVALYARPLGVADGHFCGGTVIAPRWILTAAHCIYDEGLLPADQIGIMAASNSLSQERGQVLARAEALFVNARYLLDENADLGLIRLTEDLPLGTAIQALAPAGAGDAGLRAAGKEGVVTGWGATDTFGEELPDLLQEARLPIAGARRCGEEVDTEQQLCAGKPEGGASACFGDSGGPFMVQDGGGAWKQVGITSAVSDDYCGIPGSLSFFTRVDAFGDWVALKQATGQADKVLLNQDLRAEATGEEPALYAGQAITLVDPLLAPATPQAGPSATATVVAAASVTATSRPAGSPTPGPGGSTAPATQGPASATYLPFLRNR